MLLKPSRLRNIVQVPILMYILWRCLDVTGATQRLRGMWVVLDAMTVASGKKT